MELIDINDNFDMITEKLKNREYRKELTKTEEEILKDKHILVIFWASDDLLESRWFIDDELSAYGSWTVNIDVYKNRLLSDKEYYLMDTAYNDIVLKDIIEYYYNMNTIELEYDFTDKWWRYQLTIQDKFKEKIKYKKNKIKEDNNDYWDMLIIQINT